jgi:hypothetical protein
MNTSVFSPENRKAIIRIEYLYNSLKKLQNISKNAENRGNIQSAVNAEKRIGSHIKEINNINSKLTSKHGATFSTMRTYTKALREELASRKISSHVRRSEWFKKIRNARKVIPIPSKIRNNKNIFTGNRFKSGIPYVEVTLPSGKFYYNVHSFHRWFNAKGTDPMTRSKINARNFRTVIFNVPKNITNKANSMRKNRAARTIARAWTKGLK